MKMKKLLKQVVLAQQTLPLLDLSFLAAVFS